MKPSKCHDFNCNEGLYTSLSVGCKAWTATMSTPNPDKDLLHQFAVWNGQNRVYVQHQARPNRLTNIHGPSPKWQHCFTCAAFMHLIRCQKDEVQFCLQRQMPESPKRSIMWFWESNTQAFCLSTPRPDMTVICLERTLYRLWGCGCFSLNNMILTVTRVP